MTVLNVITKESCKYVPNDDVVRAEPECPVGQARLGPLREKQASRGLGKGRAFIFCFQLSGC